MILATLTAEEKEKLIDATSYLDLIDVLLRNNVKGMTYVIQLILLRDGLPEGSQAQDKIDNIREVLQAFQE